jgi:energy-coupling factor transport system permease protein
MLNRSRFLIGQYRPGTGLLYRLDPRTKIIFVFLIMTAALVKTSLIFYAILTLLLLTLLISCGLNWRMILGNLKPIVWFVALTAAFHLLFSGKDDPEVMFTILGYAVSHTAAFMAITYSARILIFVLSTFVLSLTTNPVSLSEGIISLLSPLKFVKIPVQDLGMILFIALRFIPVLADEVETIRKTQMIRGVQFTGKLRARIKRSTALILPVFFSALRRADDLSVAIYTRGYRSGRPRSSLQPLKFAAIDYAVITLSLLMMAVLLILRRTA